MKRGAILIYTAFLMLLNGALFGYGPLGYGPQGDNGVLKRVSMEVIINELNVRGLRVALITNPPTRWAGITKAEEIKMIEALPEEERTANEKTLLAFYQTNSGPDDAIVAQRGDSYNITLPEDFPTVEAAKDTLNRVVALDTQYELIWAKDFPVICPRNSPVKNARIDLILNKVPAFPGVELLAKKLPPHDIYLTLPTFSGQTSANSPPWSPAEFFWTNQLTLKFDNTPVIDVLCQFAEALGPYYTWFILIGQNCSFARMSG